MELLAGPEASRDQKRVHGRSVLEGVVRQNRETSLGLDGPKGVCDQERVELRIEPPGHGKHAVRCGEVHDLRVFEDIDSESKPGYSRVFRHGVLRLDLSLPKSMMPPAASGSKLLSDPEFHQQERVVERGL